VQAAKGGEDERLEDSAPALHDMFALGIFVGGREVASLVVGFLVDLEMGGTQVVDRTSTTVSPPHR
jgi:hypothetical protein